MGAVSSAVFLTVLLFWLSPWPEAPGVRRSTGRHGHGARGEPPLTCERVAEVEDGRQRCERAWELCEAEGFVNYVALLHCHSRLVTVPLFAVAVAFLIYLLGDIAEAHFCPSLEFLSDHLRLAPAVAGPTLLAFGNGSPDISSSLIGLVVNPGAQDLGLNSPLGGGLFVISVVVALVIMQAGVHVEPRLFYRDAGFYLLAVLLLVYIVSDGLIHAFEALALLLLYAVYVLVVVAGDQKAYTSFALSRASMTTGSMEAASDNLLRHMSLPSGANYFTLVPAATADEHHDSFPAIGLESSAPAEPSPDALRLHIPYTTSPAQSFRLYGTSSPRSAAGGSHRTLRSAGSARSLRRLPSGEIDLLEADTLLSSALHTPGVPEFMRATLYRYSKFRYKRVAKHNALYGSFSGREGAGLSLSEPLSGPRHVDLVGLRVGDAVRQFLVEDLDWHQHTGVRWVLFALLLPTKLAFYLTVPPVSTDPDDWRKLWAVTCPVFTPGLFLLAVGATAPAVVVGTAAGGLVAAVAVYHTTHVKAPPSWAPVFAFVAFGASILWMFLVAREVMGLLQAVGLLLHISQPMLAVTILAWGNCVGDLAADLAMAHQGFGTTAVCATYGGPLLTLCVGLGSAFACQAILHFPAFPLGKVKEDVAFCLFSLVLCLLVSLVGIPLTGFRPGPVFGSLLLLLYAAFFSCMMAYERGALRFDWLPFPECYCAAPSGGHCKAMAPP